MRAFHDTRNPIFRAPFGAVMLGTSITLALDIWDAPQASVMVRTWIDGVGEQRIPMHAVEYQPDRSHIESGDYPAIDDSDLPVRYEATLTPKAPGIVWYQFAISENNQHEQRYGALDGRTGGVGRLAEWEPPSFLLAVCEDAEEGAPLLPAYLESIEKRPFERMTVSFLLGEMSAFEFVESIETLRENYPSSTWDDIFCLLDTPNRPSLFTRLSGKPTEREEHAGNELPQFDDRQLGLAKGRLWSASLIQALALDYTISNPTSIDSNFDESAKHTAPNANAARRYTAESWEHIDKDCGDIVRNASELRNTLPVFVDGQLEFFALNDDVLGFWRRNDKTAACVLINSSLQNAYDLPVPMCGEAVSDVLGGYDIPIKAMQDAENCTLRTPAADTYAITHLWQLGTAVLFFHPRQRLGRPMDTGLGVLSHITSLPTGAPTSKGARQRPGTLGEPARKFIDWLSKSNMRYWQVLPVNPTDEHGSPYAGISAFAGNTRLLENKPMPEADQKAVLNSPEFRDFCTRESDWLDSYAYFMSIRQKIGNGKPWQKWPKKYRSFNRGIIEADEDLCRVADEWRLAQYTFDCQWKELHAYANEHGVQIIGDMPIYVSADSSDVWANPAMFQLGSDGMPGVVAGCPPDSFAEEGQVWGNPVYDWTALKAENYAWWLRRLERAFELYDWVRLDHFIGFSRYYSIPAGEKATEGSYHLGPGLPFFEKAYEEFGPLPIIAEDLGSITPAVRALGAACGFQGMDIVQFADGNDPLSGYQPRPEKIAYTGTHDNQTLVGYCAERYPHLEAVDAARNLAETVATCSARICIMPLQDILELDDEARMNVPGTVKGNWAWQAKPKDVEGSLERAQELAKLHNAAHQQE